MYYSFLIHLSASGPLGFFHVQAIVNSATVNIGENMSLSIQIPGCVRPAVGFLDHMAVLFPAF